MRPLAVIVKRKGKERKGLNHPAHTQEQGENFGPQLPAFQQGGCTDIYTFGLTQLGTSTLLMSE